MHHVFLWHWLAFAAFVAGLLALDLTVFHRRSRETTLREAGLWTLVWCLLALAFDGLVWRWLGRHAAAEFLTGYVIEWSLSMDNVFVFAMIFAYFMVARKYQYRVLFWGILGAVFMRLSFVLVGAQLLRHFEWVSALLGLFLVYSGARLCFHGESKPHPEKNVVLRLARRLLPVSSGSTGDRFFVREAGRWCMTPLMVVLVVIETTDVMFAVDSVPAILGVVNKQAGYFTFIVFTSNVFAILGLRALYFLLAAVMDLFRYLNYGLSSILAFVGLKMLAEYFYQPADGGHLVPAWASLLTVVTLLTVSILASLWSQWRQPRLTQPAATPHAGPRPADHPVGGPSA